MKKSVKVALAILAVVLVMVMAIVGCAKPAATATVTETVAAEAAKAIKMNVQTHSPAGDVFWMQTERFCMLANEASGGRLELTPQVGGAVVPSTKELEGVMDGSLDMGATDSSFGRGILPAAGPFSTTMGGLTMIQQILWYTMGEGGDLCAELYDQVGVQYIDLIHCNGPEIWLSSVKPVNSLADLKGYNMRVLGEAADALAKLGVNTVMLPGGEVYEATQRGTIDGFDYSSPVTNWSMGFQEVIKYMYMSPTRAPSSNGILFMDKDKWAELPDDLKAVIHAAARYYIGTYTAEQTGQSVEALKKFEDYGTIIEPLPADIDAEFMKVAKAYYDEQSAKDPFYAKVIQSQRAWKAICEEMGIQ